MSGLDATQIQGVPISTATPTNNQGLLYNAGTGEWTPTNLNAALEGNNGINIGLDGATGAATITWAANSGRGITITPGTPPIIALATGNLAFVGVSFSELASDVPIPNTGSTGILAVGPFNVGQILTITTWITITNTGSTGLFSPDIQIGNNSAPVTPIATTSLLIPASSWANCSISAAYTVSAPNNYIWVTGVGQSGSTFVAKATNASALGGATGVIIPTFA